MLLNSQNRRRQTVQHWQSDSQSGGGAIPPNAEERTNLRISQCLHRLSEEQEVNDLHQHPETPNQILSLPDACPRSDRVWYGGREREFLAVMSLVEFGLATAGASTLTFARK